MINEKLLQEVIQKHLPKAFVGYGQQGFMCQVHYPELCKIINDYVQQQVSVEPEVKPESGELSLGTMIDNLPQNRILYKDSGLWMIIDEEDFNTTDKMLFQVARYQQTTKETFAQFIKRCFDSGNEYYIENY